MIGDAAAAAESTGSRSTIGADEIVPSLDHVARRVEDHDYRGDEPFDESSSWARPHEPTRHFYLLKTRALKLGPH